MSKLVSQPIFRSNVVGTGETFYPEGEKYAFQVKITGTGALTGVAELWVTNTPGDVDSWMLLATVNVSGTDKAVNGTRQLDRSYSCVRVTVPVGGITGTGAILSVNMGE